ncbi:MAG: DUF3305 domain-containing protein [Variovorax sp.]
MPDDERPSLSVAVVLEREREPNRWEAWRFRLVEVTPQEDAFGDAPRVLRDDGKLQRTLYPGFAIDLYADEAEGYYLNLSSGTPVWFVKWRIAEDDPSRAWPETVSLSYNEAGRWLDAQERVDNVPLTPDVTRWLQTFTDEHYRPEPKKRRRPQSFVAPGQRQ